MKKYFVIEKLAGEKEKVSIDGIKPAFIPTATEISQPPSSNSTNSVVVMTL